MKVVQQLLGHKSATMTLDLYGHLFGDQFDDVADRWTRPHGRLAAFLLTEADAITLPAAAASY